MSVPSYLVPGTGGGPLYAETTTKLMFKGREKRRLQDTTRPRALVL